MQTLSKQQNRFRVFIVGLIMASLILAIGLSPKSSEALQNTPIGTGDNSPFGMNYIRTLDPDKQLGNNFTREIIHWHEVEPLPGQWDWTFPDPLINMARTRGEVVAVLGYGIRRDGSGRASMDQGMPDLNAWGNFVRNTVARYKDQVKYWQIWNEPNGSDFFTHSDPNYAGLGASPAQYAQILARAYDAVKAETGGNGKVLTGGVVPAPEGLIWLDQMLDAGGRGKFDVVAFHPYVNSEYFGRGSTSPESTYWGYNDLNLINSFAVKNNAQVWATEFGWSTTQPFGSIDQNKQANYIVRAYVMGLSDSKLSKMFVYQYHDAPEEGYPPKKGLGIVEVNGTTPKQAFGAYQTMVARLTGSTPIGRVQPILEANRFAVVEDFEGKSGATSCNGNGSPTLAAGWSCYTPSGVSVNVNVGSFGGRSSVLKASYNFSQNVNPPYVSLKRDPIPATTLRATKAGFWIYNDGDGNQSKIRLNIKDANGQGFNYLLGHMGPTSAGWQRMEANLANAEFPRDTVNIAYPIKSVEVLIDAWPKESRYGSKPYGGTLYLDDFYFEESPQTYIYRFKKNGNSVVDVVWADSGDSMVNVAVPTNSGQGTVYSRNGQSSNQTASNGRFDLSVNGSPIYIEHEVNGGIVPPITTPPSSVGPTPTPTPTTTQPPVTGCGSVFTPQYMSSTDSAFGQVWNRTDDPVMTGRASRSWMWGDKPNGFALLTENYGNGNRLVQYHDKSRMEINNPNGDRASLFFVTNGLLVKELISGQMQTGDANFVNRCSAEIPIAGDSDGASTPTYASFKNLIGDAQRVGNQTGQTVNKSLTRNGSVDTLNSVPATVRLVQYEATTGHNIPDVFWNFMNNTGTIRNANGSYTTETVISWLYAMGYPISEPYWTRAKVGGVERDVLVQAFERRVLTYTPTNSAAFQVEMGNVGRHYATWRYNLNPN